MRDRVDVALPIGAAGFACVAVAAKFPGDSPPTVIPQAAGLAPAEADHQLGDLN